MSIIASVLNLSRKDVSTLKITDPYSIHRVVFSLFEDVRSEADKNAGVSSGILFADRGGDHESRRILMLSNRPPASSVEGQHGVVNSKVLGDEFLTHSAYNFSIIINPTWQSAVTRKLVPVKGRNNISTWFCERAPASWGFSVNPESVRVNNIDVLSFKSKTGQPITLAQAHIQGELRVTDSVAFRKSFTHGIGRGRAFGCGLLQIVPIAQNPFA
jgi:CRISPR system Cascade subunit CasE